MRWNAVITSGRSGSAAQRLNIARRYGPTISAQFRLQVGVYHRFVATPNGEVDVSAKRSVLDRTIGTPCHLMDGVRISTWGRGVTGNLQMRSMRR